MRWLDLLGPRMHTFSRLLVVAGQTVGTFRSRSELVAWAQAHLSPGVEYIHEAWTDGRPEEGPTREFLRVSDELDHLAAMTR